MDEPGWCAFGVPWRCSTKGTEDDGDSPATFLVTTRSAEGSYMCYVERSIGWCNRCDPMSSGSSPAARSEEEAVWCGCGAHVHEIHATNGKGGRKLEWKHASP